MLRSMKMFHAQDVLLPLHVNSSTGANDGSQSSGGEGGGGQRRDWSRWSVMGLRVFLIICLILLADAQKWPITGDCQPCQCYYEQTRFGRMRTVNCSKRGLMVMPQNFPSDVMVLDLAWNSLTIGQLQHVCQLTSLQALSLSNNQLTTLSTILAQCTSLLELNLTGNRLIRIDMQTLHGLDNLKRLLGLEVESITSRDVFRHLTNLKDLDLFFHGDSLPKGLFDDMVIQSLNLVLTRSTSVPKGVFEFGQMTLNTLQLIGENVTDLKEDLLDGLNVLRRFYLTMPRVAQLPERFFRSQQQVKQQALAQSSRPANLQEVEISGIGSLPPKLFSQLANMETLTLKNIGSFPQIDFLTEVVNLRMLVITGSKLTRIPASWFKELYSLKDLKLSGVQLERLHENAFEGLMNLNHLDLSNNRLEQITGQMLQPVSQTLETLILSGNRLNGIGDDMLNNLRSLHFLDVGENILSTIDYSAFTGLTYLSVVYLNSNHLTSLPEDLFKDQQQLQTLSVADNYLADFPTVVLQLKVSLISLDLSSNELRSLPAAELCQFNYLENVDLRNNLLHCDCRLLAFKDCPQVRVDGQCKSPTDLADRYLFEVQVTDTACMSTVSEGPDSNLHVTSIKSRNQNQQTTSPVTEFTTADRFDLGMQQQSGLTMRQADTNLGTESENVPSPQPLTLAYSDTTNPEHRTAASTEETTQPPIMTLSTVLEGPDSNLQVTSNESLNQNQQTTSPVTKFTTADRSDLGMQHQSGLTMRQADTNLGAESENVPSPQPLHLANSVTTNPEHSTAASTEDTTQPPISSGAHVPQNGITEASSNSGQVPNLVNLSVTLHMIKDSSASSGPLKINTKSSVDEQSNRASTEVDTVMTDENTSVAQVQQSPTDYDGTPNTEFSLISEQVLASTDLGKDSLSGHYNASTASFLQDKETNKSQDEGDDLSWNQTTLYDSVKNTSTTAYQLKDAVGDNDSNGFGDRKNNKPDLTERRVTTTPELHETETEKMPVDEVSKNDTGNDVSLYRDRNNTENVSGTEITESRFRSTTMKEEENGADEWKMLEDSLVTNSTDVGMQHTDHSKKTKTPDVQESFTTTIHIQNQLTQVDTSKLHREHIEHGRSSNSRDTTQFVPGPITSDSKSKSTDSKTTTSANEQGEDQAVTVTTQANARSEHEGEDSRAMQASTTTATTEMSFTGNASIRENVADDTGEFGDNNGVSGEEGVDIGKGNSSVAPSNLTFAKKTNITDTTYDGTKGLRDNQTDEPGDKIRFLETSDDIVDSPDDPRSFQNQRPMHQDKNPDNKNVTEDENSNGKERIAFNFIISALSAVAMFCVGLLVICCLRRCQRHGSYILDHEEAAELEVMDSGILHLKMKEEDNDKPDMEGDVRKSLE